jgi:hypothetical protein
MKLVTKYQIPVINSCLEKFNEKCAYTKLFGHKLNIGMPYCGKRFWPRQIPTSCLPTKLVFIQIDHICTFFVTFFSATIDGRVLIFGHKLHIGTPYCEKRFWTRQIPTSCLPKSGGIIHLSEH